MSTFQSTPQSTHEFTQGLADRIFSSELNSHLLVPPLVETTIPAARSSNGPKFLTGDNMGVLEIYEQIIIQMKRYITTLEQITSNQQMIASHQREIISIQQRTIERFRTREEDEEEDEEDEDEEEE